MSILPHIQTAALCLSCLNLPLRAAESTPEPPKPDSRTERAIEGWTVAVDDRLLDPAAGDEGSRILKSLESRLAAITAVVAPDRLTKLRGFRIVLDQSHGKLRPMQYHPSKSWLEENGYAQDLWRCVHIPVAKDLLARRQIDVHPWVILHELAHAYHDQVLGFDEARIRRAYSRFKESGHGTKALHADGSLQRHYGLTNHKEFFAEMTESYLGTNDFFPFNRGELKSAEPEIFGLMAEIWGPVDTPARPPSPTGSQPASPISPAQAASVMWYQNPAETWIEALPVGNGRLGAMVFGGPNEERIQFNEDTRWSGGPYEPQVTGGAEALAEVRRLIFAGDYRQAHKHFGRHLMGHPIEQQKYQSFGDLVIQTGGGEITGYHRQLDLDSAVTTTRFVRDGVTHTREVFVSPVDDVMVVRLSADRPGSVSIDAQLRGIRNTSHSNYGNDLYTMDGHGEDGLVLRGKSADYLGVEGKLRYEARLKGTAKGGELRVKDDHLIVQNADEVTLYLAAATNFENYQSLAADPQRKVQDALQRATAKPYDAVLSDHLAEHRRLFRRLSVDLGTVPSSTLPTNERLDRESPATDPALAALVLQYGRYLLITSSRPGTQPANLQGIWNEDMNPKWDAKYTININIQMNYWPAEPGNLAECTQPLFKMVEELSETGAKLARDLYDCGGWVTHQNTDLWRAGAPMDGPNWGAFTVGGAWLGTHLWEHQLFNPDMEKLAAHYPLLKGSAEFFLDYLVPDPKTGKLVTCPSTSPENSPAHPANQPFFDDLVSWMSPGTTLCAGSTIDQQIVADVFDQAAQAALLLGRDEDFRKRVTAARAQLAPMQIGREGDLQEWLEDWPQSEASHRHISQLYGLFPGAQISPRETPELAKAAEVVLEQRGLKGTGWSSAWKTACWTRLGRPDKAMANFDFALNNYTCPNLFSLCSNYPQVDGSHGFSAAIMEMLLQSQGGEIHLLPSLPKDRWPAGSIRGIRARGGFELDIRWSDGSLAEALIRSESGSICRIRSATPLEIITADGSPVASSGDGIIEFPTEPGAAYQVRPRR